MVHSQSACVHGRVRFGNFIHAAVRISSAAAETDGVAAAARQPPRSDIPGTGRPSAWKK